MVELAHYGVLGMKWGVRRYQQYPKGYKGDGRFFGEKVSPKYQNVENYNSGFVIKKGSQVTRFTGSGKSVDPSRPTYAVTSRYDRNMYGSVANQLPSVWGHRKIDEVVLQAENNLRIASGKQATKYVLDKYGDRTLKDLSKTGMLNETRVVKPGDVLRGRRKYILNTPVKDLVKDSRISDDKKKEILSEASKMSVGSGSDLFEKGLYDMSSYFKKKGYSGFVDPEDYNHRAKDKFDPVAPVVLAPNSKISEVGRNTYKTTKLVRESNKRARVSKKK